jgi:anti-sigma factor RsiW
MSDSDRRDDRLLRLNAALDNELDATHRLELDRELEHDPQARAGLNRLSAVSDAVRRHAPREAAPASLHAAVAALARPRQATGRAYLPLAAALAAGVVIGAASQGLLVSSRAPDPVAATLTADFARAELADRPYDIASSDRHVVKPWLATRAPIGVEAVDLADKGYPLAGGRVTVIGATPAPTLVYQRREHSIAVTEMPLSLASGAAEAHSTALDGFHLIRWADRERGYVAVSDIDADELAAFVAAFRAAIGSAGGEAR